MTRYRSTESSQTPLPSPHALFPPTHRMRVRQGWRGKDTGVFVEWNKDFDLKNAQRSIVHAKRTHKNCGTYKDNPKKDGTEHNIATAAGRGGSAGGYPPSPASKMCGRN